MDTRVRDKGECPWLIEKLRDAERYTPKAVGIQQAGANTELTDFRNEVITLQPAWVRVLFCMFCRMYLFPTRMRVRRQKISHKAAPASFLPSFLGSGGNHASAYNPGQKCPWWAILSMASSSSERFIKQATKRTCL